VPRGSAAPIATACQAVAAAPTGARGYDPAVEDRSLGSGSAGATAAGASFSSPGGAAAAVGSKERLGGPEVTETPREPAAAAGAAAGSGEKLGGPEVSERPREPGAGAVGGRGGKLKRCFWCRQRFSSLLRCAGCKSVAYCSKDCQVGHWKAGHKQECAAAAAAKATGASGEQ
jgi:hypothetical protein